MNNDLIALSLNFENIREFEEAVNESMEWIRENFEAIKRMPNPKKRKHAPAVIAPVPAPAPVPALAPAPILLVPGPGPVLAPGSGAVGQYIQGVEYSTRYVMKITS